MRWPIGKSELRELLFNGVWRQNGGLVQVLGMCPVLVMSNSLVNGVSLGFATAGVMLISGSAIAALRHWVPNELRTPIFILIVAALVTMVDLLFKAYLHGLYSVLGIFIPLITTNCIVLARAEAYASRNGVLAAACDGLFMGLGLALVLAVLGGLRELLGQGTLLAGADLVFGPAARGWVLHALPAGWDYQFLPMLLPPGAFFGLALLIAAKSALDRRAARRKAAP